MRQRRYGAVASKMNEYGDSSDENSDEAPQAEDRKEENFNSIGGI